MSLLIAQDIPGGALACLNELLVVAEAGHCDLIQVRPPTEDEARFFALADSGRVAVLSCARTGTPAKGRCRSGSPGLCSRPTALSSASARARCPLVSPPPRWADQRLSRRRGCPTPENGHAVPRRGHAPSDSQRTRCHWVRSRALRQARPGAWPVSVPDTSSFRMAKEIAKKAPNRTTKAAAVPAAKVMRVVMKPAMGASQLSGPAADPRTQCPIGSSLAQ